MAVNDIRFGQLCRCEFCQCRKYIREIDQLITRWLLQLSDS
jgi:hypothetical protein